MLRYTSIIWHYAHGKVGLTETNLLIEQLNNDSKRHYSYVL